MEITLPNRQRFGTIQHVVREDLGAEVQIGDEVTSLCGEVTWRLRHKDNPNMLTCGMCALLLIREYRDLLTEYNNQARLTSALIEAIDKAAEEQESDEEEGDEYAPDVDDVAPVDDGGIGVEDVPLPDDDGGGSGAGSDSDAEPDGGVARGGEPRDG